MFRNIGVCCLIFLVIGCSTKKEETFIEQSINLPSVIENDSVFTDEFNAQINEYEAEDRDQWQHPDIILNFLGDLKGKTVADIGAGTGYFSFKLARRADTVYAVEIDQRFIDYIEERKEGLRYNIGQNVKTLLTSPDDPGLYQRKIDVVLLVNTYSYINNRIEYFQKIKQILKPKGFLCIVDFKEENILIGPPHNMKVSPEKAQQELKNAGFKDFQVDTRSLPYQYILKAL